MMQYTVKCKEHGEILTKPVTLGFPRIPPCPQCTAEPISHLRFVVGDKESATYSIDEIKQALKEQNECLT